MIIDGVGTGAVRTLIGADDANGASRAGRAAGLAGAPARHRVPVAAAPRRPDDPRRPVAHPRLGGELTALSARAGERAAEIISARRDCTVLVQGSGRVGPLVAALLAAAGVGRVHCLDAGAALLHHAMPGGLLPGDEGMSFAAAAAAAIERQAPDAACATAPFDEPPDLVVLAVDAPVDPERRNALHARSAAHLLVQVSGGTGAVGPLVLPGLTSCLRCADLHRLDRDPAWDALAVQLAVPQRHRGASEVAARRRDRRRRGDGSARVPRRRAPGHDRRNPRDAGAGLAFAPAQLADPSRLRLPRPHVRSDANLIRTARSAADPPRYDQSGRSVRHNASWPA